MCRRLLFLPLAVCLALSLMAACSDNKKSAPPKPPAPVATAAAVQKTIPVQLRTVGVVEAYTSVEVKAQISGQVLKVHFREGDDVKKGDLLFTIDPQPLQAAFEKAEAELERDIIQAENAQQEAERFAGLVEQEIISPNEYDRLQTKAKAAAAAVIADQATLEQARINLGFTRIIAPVSGRTGKLALDAGNIVKANADAGMVTINQIQPILVSFTVPEQELPLLRKYMASGSLKAEVITGQAPLKGEITFLDNSVNRSTGTISLKATFPNRQSELWPGQFVDVALILTSLPDAVLVPSPAVLTGQKGQYVFIVKPDHTVESRPVMAGVTYGGETVIKQGVTAGETVVVDGQLRLSPGARVEVKSSPAGQEEKTP